MRNITWHRATRRFSLLGPVLVSIILVSCGGGGDDDGSGHNSSDGSGASGRTDAPFTTNTVTLQSGDSATANQVVETGSERIRSGRSRPSPESCIIIADIYNTNGTCLYPVGAVGNMMSVQLHKNNTSVPGGTRLLGPDEYSEAPGSIISGSNFDLFNPVSLSTNNTLRTQYHAREQYDGISIDAFYYQIQFPLTYNNDTITQWVTMHLAMYSQPFSESDAVTNAVAQCGLSENSLTQARFTDADLLEGMRFDRGDYLFCVKDNQIDTCSPNDFQWLDTATNTLTSTRPAAPKQSHYLANNPIECSGDDNDAVSFNFGPFGLFAEIEQDALFKLWSDFSHAEYSNQWPNDSHPFGDDPNTDNPEIAWIEPFYLYYLNECPNGSCASTISQGSNLNVTLNFNTDQLIFIEGMSDDEVSEEINIGELLSKIHTRTQWGFDQKSMNNVEGFDVTQLSTMTVSAGISISGGTTPPAEAIVYCQDLDPANADEDGCGEQRSGAGSP